MGSDFLILHQAEINCNEVKTMAEFVRSVAKNQYLRLTSFHLSTPDNRVINLSKDIDVSLHHLERLATEHKTRTLYATLSNISKTQQEHNMQNGLENFFECPVYTTPSSVYQYPLLMGEKVYFFHYEILIQNFDQFIDLYSNDKGVTDDEARRKADHAMFDICLEMSQRDPGLLFIPSNAENIFLTSQDFLGMGQHPYEEDWKSEGNFAKQVITRAYEVVREIVPVKGLGVKVHPGVDDIDILTDFAFIKAKSWPWAISQESLYREYTPSNFNYYNYDGRPVVYYVENCPTETAKKIEIMKEINDFPNGIIVTNLEELKEVVTLIKNTRNQ